MARGFKTGGGSRKGRPNKSTAELKDMIRMALDKAGGVNYLVKQAKENPAPFLNLVGKILPREMILENKPFDGLSDDELAAIIARLRELTGGLEASRGGAGAQTYH